jgi:hypothetical protein
MSETVAALAGALIGGVAAVSGSWIQARTAERNEKRRYDEDQKRRREGHEAAAAQVRRTLTRRYLFQLQDSVESLRRRMDNWVNRGGELAAQSDPGYWEVTNLYALGRALAAERILALEGAYADADTKLANFLTAHTVDGAIAGAMSGKFFFYQRLSLAETMLERESGEYRLLTFAEFRRRYDDPSGGQRNTLSHAAQALKDLTEPRLAKMAAELDNLADGLEKETHVPRRLGPR